jgi:ribose/xylose/arabinose/galactoside ABC-type transport system permease subunit
VKGWLNRLGPALALGVIFALFTVLIGPEKWANAGNVETILRQTTIVGIAALGATLVILAGGIDLSVGSVVALSSVVTASLLAHSGWSPFPAALAGVAAGGLCGLANGLLITRLQVVPFIVTLGTLLIIRGAAKGLGREQKVDAPATWLNEILRQLPDERRWMLMPPGVWLMLLLALATGALLRYTRLGRHVFAVGSNEPAARLCGVAVDRVKVTVYALSGALAGLAGLMQFSRFRGVGDPTSSSGLELDAIAAVVIGGGSLSGGEGSVTGTLVGALIMAVIKAGCFQLGISNWIQEIVTGSIIVAAVALDRLRHRRSS